MNPQETHIFLHILSESATQKLDLILAQGETLMADVKTVLQIITDLDTETNDVAAKVDAIVAQNDALKLQIANGSPATQADIDAISDGLTPISARLKALGANPTDPIPA